MGLSPVDATIVSGENKIKDAIKNTNEQKAVPFDQMYATETNKAMDQVGTGANQQLANNRLNTANPFSSQTFNPDGSVSQQFTGGLGTAFQGLQGQASGLGQGMDWSQFGQVGTGDQARDQAINAAYGQATSRLDPQWDHRMEAQRTQLLNQGLDPSSAAYKNAMQDSNFARNDAYSSAMNGAIGQGTAAGNAAFSNNMAARQQAIQEALKARGMPMEELGQMQGLLAGQPQYNADNSSMAGALAKSGLLMGNAKSVEDRRQQAYANDMQARGLGAQQAAGTAQGAMSGLAALTGLAAMFA